MLHLLIRNKQKLLIHPIVVETFYSKPQMWSSLWCQSKSQGIHSLGTVNICTNFYDYLLNSCWNILIWTKALDRLYAGHDHVKCFIRYIQQDKKQDGIRSTMNHYHEWNSLQACQNQDFHITNSLTWISSSVRCWWCSQTDSMRTWSEWSKNQSCCDSRVKTGRQRCI